MSNKRKPPCGRPKGSPNKTTASVKAALCEAFEKMGGVKSLVEWGKENPGDFYRVWSRMIPTEIKNADGQPFRMVLVEQIVAADEDDSQGG